MALHTGTRNLVHSLCLLCNLFYFIREVAWKMSNSIQVKVKINLLCIVLEGIEKELFELIIRLKNNTLLKSVSSLPVINFVTAGCNDENLQYELLLKLHFAYKQDGDLQKMLARLPKEQQSFLNALLLCNYCPQYVVKLSNKAYTRHQPTDLTKKILDIVVPFSRVVIIQFEKPNDKNLGSFKVYPQLDEFELQNYSSNDSFCFFSSRVIGTKKEAQEVLESKILKGKKGIKS